MSLLKKFMGGHKTSEASAHKSQDTMLALTHLKKLFTDFKNSARKMSSEEQESKLYIMVPVFCKVFGEVPSSEMTERFGDIFQFCSYLSKLMVVEIRRRASNQSTEAASCAIVKYLEIDSTEESSNGWMLLTALNILSSGHVPLIDCMTSASLPSTLVKCLYLFFDLPPVIQGEVLSPGSEFTPTERRVLLQKVFVQIIVRLCNQVSPAEELARKDDLSLLFSAITSWCPPHNAMWRKSAADVLVTLSRHGLSNNVVKYIHEKGCVRHCIENMQRIQELSPLELVDMFVTVFCFLKDSSEVSHILLDDFKSCQGYLFLTDFLLRLELDKEEESKQALRNLVLLIGSLTTCGFTELKPVSATGSLYNLPGFTIPQPSGEGVSVRNMHAFSVLQTTFLKATTSGLCSVILDVISSIYHQDSANYFILEPQHTLSQFVEKIRTKPVDVQEKFFELVEFVIFDLNYIPCKELIAISILIKSNVSIHCSILCMKTLLQVVQHSPVFKDVFREVGLLEVLVTCLQRYAAHLKESYPEEETAKDTEIVLDPMQQQLGFLVMECLTHLLSSNASNTTLFRDCGGAACCHKMMMYTVCRQQVLAVIQQLVLSPSGDDDMGTLLCLMHTSDVVNLELKTHILKALLQVLRESHRTRTVFRKVEGFVYVMSVLINMEGCLSDPPKSPWDKVNRSEILVLLRTVFSTLTIAMRYEPANAKFFETEVRYASLTEAIRLLGCFSTKIDVHSSQDIIIEDEETLAQTFEDVFSNPLESRYDFIPQTLLSACTMIKFLYNMALDQFDRLSQIQRSDSPTFKRLTQIPDEKPSQGTPKRASTGSIHVSSSAHQELILVHAGAVLSIYHLMPAIECEENPRLTLALGLYVSKLIRNLLYTERNQQIMCDYGLPHEILSHGYVALADELHPLHSFFRAVFERLAAQSLTPKDLRDFLRLGSPLNCRPVEELSLISSTTKNTWGKNWPMSRDPSVDEPRTPTDLSQKLKTAGGVVPLTRVKCLVSMTTPKDARMHGSVVTPAFVEFDMSTEGFGCLYLPSIAPQGPPTPSVVSGVVGSSDTIVLGGIGTGERMFPPQSGMTFTSWICVEKFSTASDSHPVRLLAIVRNLQGRDENLICLSVTLNSKERSLIVSTQETLMPNSVTGVEVEKDPVLNENTVRFWCPELSQEGQWHHLVLIFHRAGIMKNSSVSLFVDSEHISTQKLHYVSPNLGVGGTASPTAFTSVFAYIGSPPQQRRISRLSWRQGPCHLMEDIVTSSTVSQLYNLGPTYIGSFQSPVFEDGEITGPLVAEEKVVFGVHAHSVLQMTVAKIRKVYNKVDSKSIAKQLAMSAHDNVTPIRMIPNSASHLSGSARSLGAVLMGYLGVRTFSPKPVARMLENIGGASALLGLIAMATDVEGFYAAVKALVCVVKSNTAVLRDLERIEGYQTLSMLYKKKQQLLNSHILHLTFSLIGTVDSGKESSIIPNRKAFKDLLCDLEVWHDAPYELQRSLYEHFFELITESSDHSNNIQLMREVGLGVKLLNILKDNKLSDSTITVITNVLFVLLKGSHSHQTLLRFGQLIVSTLPQMSTTERDVLIDNSKAPENDIEKTMIYLIRLRNMCLNVIHRLLLDESSSSSSACEDILRVLGFDWLLLFVQRHVHATTIVLALKILTKMLQNSHITQRFREGSVGGGWLKNTEMVLKQHVGVMLGLNIGTSSKGLKRELNREACKVPGFVALQWLLPRHAHVTDIYFLIIGLLLGQPVAHIPDDVQLSLDSIWSVIFGPSCKPISVISKDKQVELCADAAIVLLAIIRSMLNQESDDEPRETWTLEYPVTLMQFLLYLYHNHADFIQLATSQEFISSLAATLFPSIIVDPEDVTTPEEEFKPFPDSESFVNISTPEKCKSAFLTSHPARKFVIDFLRTIIIDSFSQPFSNKIVLDIVLNASPENSTKVQKKEYQTEILKTVMDHLLAADVLLGEQAALPIATGNYTVMANNVFYFASRVVDKLWHGVFTRESKEVFDFCSKLINQAKRKSSGVSLDMIYRSLNRTVLYQLSRPIHSVSINATILDSLHKLTSNRSLVFGPGNYDQDFLACLCYCLLQLTEDPVTRAHNLNDGHVMKTTWHISLEQGEEVTEDMSHLLTLDGNSGVREAHPLIVTASKRVWEELYACKKPVLEEIFKTPLNTIEEETTKITSPELKAVRGLIQEQASKAWVAYIDFEKKETFERLPAQIQSKIQKVGNAALRFASRKQKEKSLLKLSPTSAIHMTDYISWTLTHMSIVKDLVELNYRQYLENHVHMEKYLLEEWGQMERELLRERGLWGPNIGCFLDKWMLDMTEGPCRMRKVMVINDMFYFHYPYRPDMEDSPLKYKVAISNDSKEYFSRFRSQTLVEMGQEILPIMRGTDSGQSDTEDASPVDITSMPKLLSHTTKQPKAADAEEEGDENSNQEEQNQETSTDAQPAQKADNNQAFLRILGDGEKITNIFRCARIQGLDTAEGLLLFGREHFYVIDGFTMLRTKEIKDIDSLPPDLHDPIIPKTSKGSSSQKRLCSKFEYEDIREVLKRRYLLQPIAVEVFSGDGRNYLLAFPRKLRNKVYAKFISVATSMTDNAHESKSGQKQGAKVEAGSGLISSLMGEKSVTQRWERGEISNFQYLMHLNTLAGRSYNDLMQYPVFPWILADYDSEFLQQAGKIEHWHTWDICFNNKLHQIKPKLGNTLLSSSLSRREEVVMARLRLGHSLLTHGYLMKGEDHPLCSHCQEVELDLTKDETFRDLSKPMGAQTEERLKQFQKRYKDWDDPQGETPPYHYGTHYSSAMIVASYLVRMEPFTQHFLKLQGGHFDLADRMFHSVKENWLSASKNNMADVKELIPEFFYLPEFLLNSNNFDLGTKQSGVQLHDVLLPTWAKGDPREFIRVHREALECDYVSSHLHEWIDLIFGYKQQGPAAMDAINVFHHLFYEGNVDIYEIDDPLKKNATIGFINNFGQIPKQLFKKPHPQKKVRLLDSIPMGSLNAALADRLFFHNVDNLRPTKQTIKELKSAVGQIIHHEKYVLAVEQNKVLIPPLYGKYLSWGYADLSVRIGNYEYERATNVYECLDNGEILCASCPNDKIFITGGTSCVVNVWEYCPKKKCIQLKQPLYGHNETVTCLAASTSYNLIVSGSRDKTCIVWHMSKLLFIRQLRGHSAPVAAICVNELTGDIATCAGTYLYVWSINGEAIACVNTSTPGSPQILCVAMSQILEWDSRNVILTGSSDGVVRMWSIEYVQVPIELEKKEKTNDETNVLTENAGNLDQSDGPLSASGRRESCNSYSDLQLNSVVDKLRELKSGDSKDPDFGSSFESESLMHQAGHHGEGSVDLGDSTACKQGINREESVISTNSCYSDNINASKEDISETQSLKSYGEIYMPFDIQSNLGSSSIPQQSDPCIPSLTKDDMSQVDGKVAGQGIKKSVSSDFEVIGDNEVQTAPKTVDDLLMKYRFKKKKNALREGFRWHRQLMFRSKLTMHTAFERKDNKDPAAVTAIAVSKDHKTVYVGDAKGRIYSWTVADQPGRVVADHWVKDDGTDSCLSCGVRFTLTERKHHCRNCGHIFCSKCSKHEIMIKRLKISIPVRVCQACYNILKAQQAVTESLS